MAISRVRQGLAARRVLSRPEFCAACYVRTRERVPLDMGRCLRCATDWAVADAGLDPILAELQDVAHRLAALSAERERVPAGVPCQLRGCGKPVEPEAGDVFSSLGLPICREHVAELHALRAIGICPCGAPVGERGTVEGVLCDACGSRLGRGEEEGLE